MNKIKVKLINHSINFSDQYLSSLVKITFSEKLNGNKNIADQLLNYKDQSIDIIKNCIKFNHTSILEQVSYTFLIEGASRSLLSQITRHRLFSFISGSQHYIDYSNIGDFETPIELLNNTKEVQNKYYKILNNSIEEYKKLINSGVDHSVARQILPNAMRNNLIVTGNLREWCNFLNLRLCNRNTSEIQYIAFLIYKELMKYNPEVIKQVGPDCIITGKCTQGHKTCKEIYNNENLQKKYKRIMEE